MINGTGGNVGVRVTSEGVILIDDKFPRNFETIQARVQEVTDLPVKYVVNTHHHGDHSGGNVGYINIAEIIAHQNARDKHDPRRSSVTTADRLHPRNRRVSRGCRGARLSLRAGAHERRCGGLLPRPPHRARRRPPARRRAVYRLRKWRKQPRVGHDPGPGSGPRLRHRHSGAWRPDDEERRSRVSGSVPIGQAADVAADPVWRVKRRGVRPATDRRARLDHATRRALQAAAASPASTKRSRPSDKSGVTSRAGLDEAGTSALCPECLCRLPRGAVHSSQCWPTSLGPSTHPRDHRSGRAPAL